MKGNMAKQGHGPGYGVIVWREFKRHRLAYVSLWGVGWLALTAVLAPLLFCSKPFLWRVDDGPWASPWLAALFDRNFFESSLDMFFNSLLCPGIAVALGCAWAWRRTSAQPQIAKRRWRKVALVVALGLWGSTFATVVLVGRSHPSVAYPARERTLLAQGHRVIAFYPPFPYSFQSIDLDVVRAPMGLAHPLGTDSAGRDVLTRLVYGTRISLTVGVFAVLLYVTFGTVVGALAGYFGGWVDVVALRAIEVMMSIPSLFLLLTLAAFSERRSILQIVVIIAAVRWTTPARLVRAEFLRLRTLDFVVAARASGFPQRTIIFREMLPNALGPVLVTATFGVAASILLESTISFLGLGDITVPSWGQILSVGRSTGMWNLILAPGFAIFVTVSLLNLLGEGVRDALDPRLRR